MTDDKPMDQEVEESTEQAAETADEKMTVEQPDKPRGAALEKPLEKYTVKELKDMALALGTIQGVSAMKKQELIDVLKVEYDIPTKKERSTDVVSVIEIKKQVKSLKKELANMQEAGQRIPAMRLRKKISRLKKKTRRMARQLA
jgi:hypothetical protein